MKNFEFWNPTKIIFGQDTISQIGQEAQKFGKKALLVYGKSSIKQNGVYDKVLKSLRAAQLEVVEFSGVKSNPVLSHVQKGIAYAKQKQVDLIVTVGGGSVIDTGKAIAAGAKTDRDVWDFYIYQATIEDALPVLAVLTLAATGSEMNFTSVLTNEATQQKYAIDTPWIFPKVSILDPTTTYSVPKNYTAYGAIDIISHATEGYFTCEDTWTPIQDRFTEGLVKTVMECTETLLKTPTDYQARATIMWASTLALNGLLTAGIGYYEFPTHMIEHSLSSMYDIAHGAGLSIVTPGWMKYMCQQSPTRFAQFAKRIFGIHEDSTAKTAEKGIEMLKAWFEKIGGPTTLSAGNIPAEEIPQIAANAEQAAILWKLKGYTQEVIIEILNLCR
ncbi:iron-containing alcohol dehydrogenase [Candidatus Vecturithrix granuli]|uniref:Iron-containing alcohol dehydrogenase n=1 Tax=Vecturithrix granuli TaxID=1499967 RepID=A0A081C0E4_VECG1|nr:iron-containing alcohol dehydrogenase [Candidatus Vecturithrix granuli]